MPAFAFVLVAVEPGREQAVLTEVAEVPGVTEVYAVHGEVPILAKAEATDLESLGAVIIHGIRSVPGVVSTTTLPGARFA